MKTVDELSKMSPNGVDIQSETGKIIAQYGNTEMGRYRMQIFAEKLSEISFKNGVEFATRWIPIGEELPEKLVQVIVKFEDGWCTCTWITEDGDFAFNVKPTHWRPIELK